MRFRLVLIDCCISSAKKQKHPIHTRSKALSRQPQAIISQDQHAKSRRLGQRDRQPNLAFHVKTILAMRSLAKLIIPNQDNLRTDIVGHDNNVTRQGSKPGQNVTPQGLKPRQKRYHQGLKPRQKRYHRGLPPNNTLPRLEPKIKTLASELDPETTTLSPRFEAKTKQKRYPRGLKT